MDACTNLGPGKHCLHRTSFQHTIALFGAEHIDVHCCRCSQKECLEIHDTEDHKFDMSALAKSQSVTGQLYAFILAAFPKMTAADLRGLRDDQLASMAAVAENILGKKLEL